MRVSSWPMVPKKLQQTNRQDWALGVTVYLPAWDI
jgi:hypothetical protein